MMYHDSLMFEGFEGVPELDGDGCARAVGPLEAGGQVASLETVIDAAKTVYDPEIPVNIYELGLIYDLDIEPSGRVCTTMTLTAPGCPVAGVLPGKLAQTIAEVDGVGEVEVRLTWDPPWEMSMMSEAARVELNMF